MDKVAFVSMVTSFLSAVGVCRAADGDPDPGFGSGGVVISDLADHAVATDVAIQRDGKIVIVGTLRSNGFVAPPQLLVARYLADGTPDPDFAEVGYVTAQAPRFPEAGGNGSAVLLEDDGGILALGESDPFTHGAGEMFLVRYLSDGTLDESFGEGGFTTPSVSAYEAGDLARAAGGEILVSFARVNQQFLPEVAVSRLLADGAVDSSFGNDGLSILPRLPFGGVAALAVVRDGRIIVATSTVLDVGLVREFAFGRLLVDGAIDVSFGDGGFSPRPGSMAVDGVVRGVFARADGRVIAAGSMADTFTLVGLDDDGDLLADFADAGVLSESFATSAYALAPVPGGFVAAGGGPDFVVARVLSGGALDPTFADGGVATTPFADETASARAVAVQEDGAIVAVGRTGSSRIVLARYLGAPPLPGDANGDGLIDAFDGLDSIGEIFDGDGDAVAAVKDAGVRSAPGIDVNGDTLVSAADLVGIAAALQTASQS